LAGKIKNNSCEAAIFDSSTTLAAVRQRLRRVAEVAARRSIKTIEKTFATRSFLYGLP
jgi:hypothetical protein